MAATAATAVEVVGQGLADTAGAEVVSMVEVTMAGMLAAWTEVEKMVVAVAAARKEKTSLKATHASK